MTLYDVLTECVWSYAGWCRMVVLSHYSHYVPKLGATARDMKGGLNFSDKVFN